MDRQRQGGPEHIRDQLKDLHKVYGEAMLELRARKKLRSLLGMDDS